MHWMSLHEIRESKVIILAAEGNHFSSGHDLSDLQHDMRGFPTVGTAGKF